VTSELTKAAQQDVQRDRRENMSTELAAMDNLYARETIETIKQTVCKGATDAQLKIFLEVCRATTLNPFLREVWFVPSVGIMAGRDGYLAIANRHPQFDGIETRVERDEKNVPIKAICTVWRKDRAHPIICEAYYSEYKKSSGVWSQYPSAMISKVAEVLALKRSFAINGVVTEEEIGTGEPRGSAEASRAVAEAKIAGEMPLVAPQAAPEPPAPADVPTAPVDPLAAVLSSFGSKAAITAALAELKKAWLKYESEDAWLQTLEQFDIAGENYRSVGNAKRCFTALWKAVEKMMEEQNAQNAQ
jgi:phage recombination protein Bet